MSPRLSAVLGGLEGAPNAASQAGGADPSGIIRLRRLVRRMRTDPVQIERAAAEHLLVARPGSVIYRFPDDE